MIDILKTLTGAVDAARKLEPVAKLLGGPAVAAMIDIAEGYAKVGEATLANAAKGAVVLHATDRASIEQLVTDIRADNKRLAAEIAAS